MKYSIFLFVIIGMFAGSTAFAQVSDISINVIPTMPGPNEQVTAEVLSNSTDINSANITWYVNGKKITSGYGAKSIVFNSGNLGAQVNISVSARTKEGALVSANTQIIPASVDLLWQSESFVPPFYRGKAMYSHENKITFVAIPHITSKGKEIDSKNFVYKWTVNGQVRESDSGYAKNTFTMVGPLISRPLDVEVDVSYPQNNTNAHARLVATPEDPSIVIYEVDPLYGIQFQKALTKTVSLTSKEITLISYPLFFGAPNHKVSNITYDWKINGISTSEGEKWNNLLTLRPQDGSKGESYISLSISNSLKILQTATGGFKVSFNSDPSASELQ